MKAMDEVKHSQDEDVDYGSDYYWFFNFNEDFPQKHKNCLQLDKILLDTLKWLVVRDRRPDKFFMTALDGFNAPNTEQPTEEATDMVN